MDRSIGVECWADKYFFGRLLQNKSWIRKEKNKNEVIKSLTQRSNGQFSIGIVDKDRKDINSYFAEKLVENAAPIDAFTQVIKLKDNNHYIIELCPNEFEDWIITFLNSCGQSVTEFGYQDVREFKEDSKVIEPRLLCNERILTVLNSILRECVQSENHINKVRRLILYLIENKYDADFNELKNV